MLDTQWSPQQKYWRDSMRVWQARQKSGQGDQQVLGGLAFAHRAVQYGPGQGT